MTDSNGKVVLTTIDVQAVIRQARLKVAEVKQTVDGRISSLTEEKRSNTEHQLAELEKARSLRDEAAGHARRGINWHLKIGPRGGTTRQFSPNYKEQTLADRCRKQAAEYQAKADQYAREIKRIDAELGPLTSRGARLTTLAAPMSRDLPLREFWDDFPADQRDQLERVGISQAEFRALLFRVGLTEASFVGSARELEQQVRSKGELSLHLRRYLQDRLAQQAKGPALLGTR